MDIPDFPEWLRLLPVVVDKEGYTEKYHRAVELGIVPDVVFIRNDKWCLAATNEFAQVAYELWKDEWIGFYRYGNNKRQDISTWDSSDVTS